MIFSRAESSGAEGVILSFDLDNAGLRPIFIYRTFGTIDKPAFREKRMRLYDLELSGNCYKVRLFLSLIGQGCERVPVDFLGGAHKQPPLIELNPFGEIPILVDGDLILRDSQRFWSISRGNTETKRGCRATRARWR